MDPIKDALSVSHTCCSIVIHLVVLCVVTYSLDMLLQNRLLILRLFLVIATLLLVSRFNLADSFRLGSFTVVWSTELVGFCKADT